MIEESAVRAAAFGDAEGDRGPIARYDLAYRDVFWADRDYEDRCDRIALRALLPPRGDHLVEIGAGFGRLADEYRGYRSVTLFDPSAELLAAARERFAHDLRFRFVVGDAHRLPFDDESFDAIVCVRVVHNLAEPGQVFREFARVLRPQGVLVLVLEFANKRHLKAILRWLARQQAWSPFSREPHEYLPLHFDRSPAEIRDLLEAAGIQVTRTRTASLFRLPALRRRVSSALLAAIERPLQAPLGVLAIGPSVYLRGRRGP